MKKLLLLLFLGFTIVGFSQNTAIPDSNFEQALIDLGFDTAPINGSVPTANISGVTSLNVSYKNITDLTGIEDFTALATLRCYDNQLTSLDVSNNTALNSLFCFDNQLTSLDVSNNTGLINLSCEFNQLISLDVSNNTALNYLNCRSNQLTSLDVSNNTALNYLNCRSNQLTSLDVSNNTALITLYCYSNQLTSLDVSNNPALDTLGCDFNQLTSLDVSNNIALNYLNCRSNQLTSLDVSNNTALTNLNCRSNQLTSLDVSTNSALTYLSCYSNQLTSLDLRNGNNTNFTFFYSTNNPDLTCIFVDDASYSTANWTDIDPTSTFVNNEAECEALNTTAIPDSNFEQALIDLGFDTAPINGSVPTDNISAVTSLDVSNYNIADLTGIEDFIALTYLNCRSNELTSLDVSNNTALITLYCDSNQLTSLDVRNGNNTNFTNFYSTNNPDLTCIFVDDASYSTANWTDIDPTSTFVDNEAECEALNTTAIPDSNFEQALIDLGIDTAPINGSVPTANISAVTSLDVSNYNIANLTGIEDFTALTYLECWQNQITSLDLSNNTALTELYCRSNQLTSLDVSNNTALTILLCFENQLTSLDVSNNNALLSLDCGDNQLTSLDVRNGNNTNFTNFYSTNNPDLTCIFVDDASYSTANWTDIDPTSTFVDSDTSNPTITCPEDQEESVDANCNFTLPDYTSLATTTDNCTDVTVSQVPAPGTIVETGTTTIVLTATNGASNTATCNFDVLVSDNTNPTITCPEDQGGSFYGGCNFSLPDYTYLATATDNCTDVTLSQVPAPGTIVGIGSTTIVLTATDGASNTATCNFDVLVFDTINPTIICPEDQEGTANASCFTLPDYTSLATTTDNCTDVTLSQVPAPGTIVETGTTTIVLTATDGSSNTATCNFDVLVSDNTNPTITCPEDQEGLVDESCNFTLPNYTSLATTADNCTVVTVTQVPAPGTIVGIGSTTIVLTATDGSSNTATCNFDVLVSDNTNPTITCPEDQEGLVDESCNFTLPDYTSLATATDNCTDVTLSQVPAPGTVVGIGTTTIVLTATDGASNTATCNFDVLVFETTNPIITCPEDQEESVDANCNFTLPDYTSLATATDNCTDVTVTQVPAPGTIVGIGSTTIVLTATDGSSNTATCNFDVLVSDTTNPIITCPEDQEESVDSNCNFTLPDYTSLATAADNCTVVTVTQLPVAGTIVDLGSTTIVLTATDGASNTATCNFDVLVSDNTNPTITCPEDQEESVDANCNFTLPDYTSLATVADNCTDVTVSQVPAPGTVVGIGSTTIVLTVDDGNGQTATCTTVITVEDNEDPVITCAPDGTRDTDPGLDQYTLVGTEFDATFTDNCTSGSITNDLNGLASIAGVILPKGATTVIWTVDDGNGQTATCTTVITVEDNEDPVITCAPDGTRDTDPGLDQYTVVGTEFDATFTDNCPDGSITNDMNGTDTITGEILVPGVITVVWTVIDGNGQTAICATVITVEDNEAPVALCQDITVLLDQNGQATISANYLDGGSTDNVGIISFEIDIDTFLCDNIGEVSVTLTVADASGNTDTCIAVVSVIDTINPVIVCPVDITVDPGAGNLYYEVPDYFATGEASAVDNCTDPLTILSQDPAAGTLLPDGIYPVTMMAIDEYGNMGTCTFILTIESMLGKTDVELNIGSIVMHPNPSKDMFILSNPQAIALQQVVIYDYTGRLIQTINLSDMGTQKMIDVSQLATAPYMVVIQSEKGQITKLLIKE